VNHQEGIVFKSLIFNTVEAIRTLATKRVVIECDHIPFLFENVPIRKIINWLLVETSVYIRPKTPWGWPTHLQIEPTNCCNLRCTLCPVSEGMDRPKGFMDLKLFTRLIDETGDFVFLILLWDWGEPFLNPSVYEMIEYAKRRGIKVVSSTNGHIFERRENAEKLVRSGIDTLIFAIDGIRQETYVRYREGGDLGTVVSAIKQVVAAKEALGSKTPLINLRFIVMKHNEHEIPELVSFARNLGVDALTLRTLYAYDDGEYCATKKDGKAFLPENPIYQRFRLDPKTRSRMRRKRNPCKTLWNNPAIHWDGKVCPCTFDPHEKSVLGDLTQRSFKDIWVDSHYQLLRRQFRKDYQQVRLCSECTNAFEGGSCSTDDIVEEYFFA
jgi:radical SAM protein with 4Fe4S-binding SPASM domain